MREGKRVVLVKPGDTLLIGNIPDITPEMAELLSDFFIRQKISVAVFASDIDVDLLEGE